MTREEAKKILTHLRNGKSDLMLMDALDMAVSVLSEELSEDGTLTVHVSDGSKVKRVFVMGENIFGGLYYPDSDNKGEWVVVADSYHEDGTIYESHWECSKCGSGRSGWGEFKFCPDCGADMRGET